MHWYEDHSISDGYLVSFELWPCSFWNDSQGDTTNDEADQSQKDAIMRHLVSPEFRDFLNKTLNEMCASYPNSFTYWYGFYTDNVEFIQYKSKREEEGPKLGVGVRVNGRVFSKINIDPVRLTRAVQYYIRRDRSAAERFNDAIRKALSWFTPSPTPSPASTYGKNVRRIWKRVKRLATYGSLLDHIVMSLSCALADGMYGMSPSVGGSHASHVTLSVRNYRPLSLPCPDEEAERDGRR